MFNASMLGTEGLPRALPPCVPQAPQKVKLGSTEQLSPRPCPRVVGILQMLQLRDLVADHERSQALFAPRTYT